MILKYYELKWKIKYFVDDCKWFFPNVWKFRKELKDFRPWHYTANLALFRRSLELTYELIDKYGKEEESSKKKTLSSLYRAIELLKLLEQDHLDEENQWLEELCNLIVKENYGMRSWWD